MKFFLLPLIFTFILYTTDSHCKIYPYTQNNRLTLLEDVDEAGKLKFDLVDNAKHHIHILTFYWDNSPFANKLANALIEANKRGVEVRVLTTFYTSFVMDIFGKGSRGILKTHDEKEAIFSFQAFKPYDNFVMFNGLHEKIFLIDGEYAILGGRNISKAQFNNRDMEILVEGPIVNQVQDHFKIMNDFLIDVKLEKKCKRPQTKSCRAHKKELLPTRFSANDPLYFPEQIQFSDRDEARLITHNVLKAQRENNYRGSKKRREISDDLLNTVMETPFEHLRGYNYFIIPTPAYKNFLIEKSHEGRNIEIITNSLYSAAQVSTKGYIYGLPDMLKLSKEGINFIEWQGPEGERYLHKKIMIFDNTSALVSSHNFAISNTATTNELGLQIKSPKIISRLIETFEYEKSNPELTNSVDTEFIQKMSKKKRLSTKILRLGPLSSIMSDIY